MAAKPVPASIRFRNPGAMWGGAFAAKWGALNGGKGTALPDGTGQGNTIAQFPDYVSGIAAQVALWRAPRYHNKPFKTAIVSWSGGNNVPDYIALVASHVPGFTGDTIIDDAFLLGPNGIAFVKAQAFHEAGRAYPAPDTDWIEGRRRAFAAASPTTTMETKMSAPAATAEPAWLQNARKFSGLKEIIGSKHEGKILQFFAEAGHPEIHDDETPWCAAFANAMMRGAGYAGTGSLAARSFQTWGEKLSAPKLGCIVVFKRGNSAWQGHVAFFLRDLGDKIEVLGGNQGNAVSIARYAKADVLGYRWPAVAAAPVAAPANPAKETGKAGAAAGAGATVVVVGKAGIDAGWGWLEWSIVGAVVVALCVAAYFGWRWWRARRAAQAVTEAPAAPVAEMVAAAKTRPVKPRAAAAPARRSKPARKTSKRKPTKRKAA